MPLRAMLTPPSWLLRRRQRRLLQQQLRQQRRRAPEAGRAPPLQVLIFIVQARVVEGMHQQELGVNADGRHASPFLRPRCYLTRLAVRDRVQMLCRYLGILLHHQRFEGLCGGARCPLPPAAKRSVTKPAVESAGDVVIRVLLLLAPCTVLFTRTLAAATRGGQQRVCRLCAVTLVVAATAHTPDSTY